MAIDEFGREIPHTSSRRQSPPPSPPPYHTISTMRYEDMGRPPTNSTSSSSNNIPPRSPSPKRHRSPSPIRKRRRRHPVEVYVDEPLLCEYLWRKEESNDDSSQQQQQQQSPSNDDASSYDSYRKKYCLDFIRSFFNAHLDDGWFRDRFSPSCRRSRILRSRERSIREATLIKETIESSGDGDDGGGAEAFVSGARLGIGVKTTKKRKVDSLDETSNNGGGGGGGMGGGAGGDDEMIVPASHLLSSTGCCVKMTEVPPYVTDGQILQAVREHGGMSATSGVRICSSTVGLGEGGGGGGSLTPKYCNSLIRTAWVVFSTKEAKNEFIDNLNKANVEANRSTPTPQNRTIPTKQLPIPTTLELDIDCTDTYSRTEIDYDGKGSAPPTDAGKTPSKPPTKKCTVVLHPLHDTRRKQQQQQLVVLSASLSSGERIARDKTAAISIARAFDGAVEIPEGCRLDDLLDALFETRETTKTKDEDVLDVSIAYLRRVHLFSFYNACAAQCEGDVMSGFYPAGAVHLRLKKADEILGDMEGENGDGKADMLVMRLDEGLAKAVEEAGSDARFVIDEETETLAAEIDQAEEKAKKSWMNDHGLLDADGRARCSFHFCRKLFKDKTFLHKHLFKKHPEYLLGEQAKCHDSFMMQAWEKEEIRPLPQILVDCGSRFGFVPVTVTGSEPDVVDPEPEIHAKEEERIKRLEEEERERYQRNNYHKRQDYHQDVNHSANNDTTKVGGHQTNAGFVDVDDMKDEKVQLSFENVEVPLPPKKKKKKKKLL